MAAAESLGNYGRAAADAIPILEQTILKSTKLFAKAGAGYRTALTATIALSDIILDMRAAKMPLGEVNIDEICENITDAAVRWERKGGIVEVKAIPQIIAHLQKKIPADKTAIAENAPSVEELKLRERQI